MPGIVGLITKMPREWAEPQLLRMVEALCHEPFYGTGVWTDPELGIYVGWTVRKGAFSDGMPLCNERGDVVLVFSGEEFSEPGTAHRLREQGHDVKGNGPSYLVHLYEDDPTFPAVLNGRFHALLTDRRRRTATLFNDRYSTHRICYHESKEAFYFAAEAKAILAVRPELRTTDSQGLGELVSCGCVLENRTLFRSIYVLPGGSAWVFRDGSCDHRGSYFHPQEWEQEPPLGAESYYQEIRRIFSRKLPQHFNSREQIGMSLTGGLDTRMIMAWQKCPPESLPCYTFAGTFRDCRDVIVARQVAQVCQQPHQLITIGQEFLSQFPYYAERTVYFTDGCADVSRSPALYANAKARGIAPVRMTGVYGSEVLRGLRSFKPADPSPGLFSPEFLSHVHAAKKTYSTLLELHPVRFSAFQASPQRGVDALEQTQVDVRTPFLDNDIIRTAFRAPGLAAAMSDGLANNDICLRLIADGNPALRRIPTDRGLGGALGGVTGAAARNWLQFTFKSEYAYDYGMPQFVARIDHLFSSFHLERLFLGRHKFTHFRVWYRDALRKYVQEMLLDSRTLGRPYLERSGVETIVMGHLKGDRNYTTQIHQLLSLELLHRLLLEAR